MNLNKNLIKSKYIKGCLGNTKTIVYIKTKYFQVNSYASLGFGLKIQKNVFLFLFRTS